MNDEIKEILDYISDRVIEKEKWNKVKDYITNLQQENQRLQENNQAMQEEMARVWEENERLKEWKKDLLSENIELENIRKEAIEYIKQEEIEITYHELGLQWCNAKDDLLNILQNGSDIE